MTDPNTPDDTLPPEYQDTPPATQPAARDVIAEAKEALAPGGEIDQEKAAVAKLAADEAAVEADPKVKTAMVIDEIRAKLDQLAPIADLLPDPVRTAVRDVIAAVDLADGLLANIGL